MPILKKLVPAHAGQRKMPLNKAGINSSKPLMEYKPGIVCKSKGEKSSQKNQINGNAGQVLSKVPPPKVLTKGKKFPKTIHVIGMTSEDSGNEREVVANFASKNGSRNFRFSATELAFGDKKRLAIALANTGHHDLCTRQNLNWIAAEVLQRGAAKIVIVLDKTGLNKIEVDGDFFYAYVWNKKVYWLGLIPPIKVVVTSTHAVQTSCTTEEWNNAVGKYLHGNPYLIVTHAHALAAAIREMFGLPCPSIALVGPSSIGKSSAQQSAQSQIGPIDGLASMSGTKIGIINRLLESPNSPVYFQDIRQNDKFENIIDLAFDVADSTGRMKSGETLKKITATMILSNERLLEDMVSGKKNSIDEGVYARLLELVCSGPHGVFHNLHGLESAADFADSLSQNSEKYYGAVWPAWIHALSQNWPKVLRLYEKRLSIIKAKIAEQAGEAAHGRVNNRILDALSFSAWVGSVASLLGILPVKRSEIVDAFGLVLLEYISRQQSGSTPLADQIMSEVKGCLDVNSARFPLLSSYHDENQPANIYGYCVETKRHGKLFLFLPHIFTKLFNKKFGSVAYVILEKTGALVKSTSRGN